MAICLRSKSRCSAKAAATSARIYTDEQTDDPPAAAGRRQSRQGRRYARRNADETLAASARGFTLLEVLIALAIVAMSVGALLGTVTSSASNVIYLKDKTLAEWVALNRLTEMRIDQNMPDQGKRNGNTVMGGMRWEWEEEVIELPVKGIVAHRRARARHRRGCR